MLTFTHTVSLLLLLGFALLPCGAADQTPAPPELSLRVTTPGTLFIFPRGSDALLDVKLSSTRPAALAAELSAVLRDWDGVEVARLARGVELEPGGTGSERFALPTTGLRYGVYRAALALRQGDAVLAQREVQFGVCSDTVLGKAREGEFLFGLDTNLGPASDVSVDGVPVLLEWTRWMGVDIVRGGFNGWAQAFIKQGVEERLAAAEADIAAHQAYDLRIVANVDPPDDKWAKHMQRIDELQPIFAEELARRHADWLHYWEIGNEPDLPGFYEGPIERYALQYQVLYAAIKRGDPRDQVMNGGFAYRHDRVADFFRAITPEEIDIVAYHAHGVGADAERRSYRTHATIAAEHGYGDKTMADTETGLAAIKPEQEIEKARTCIEKTVFAQSQGSPFLLWFRLDMGNRPYGSLRDRVQPRPVVLAYRAMVETLRSYHFERVLETGSADLECYAFRQVDGPGRVVVTWSNAPGEGAPLDLRLAPRAQDIAALRLIDMFGNAKSMRPGRGGMVSLSVGEDPVFLAWNGQGEHRPAVDPGALPGLDAVELRPGRTQDLSVTVRNPWDEPVALTLEAAVTSPVPVQVQPETLALELAPGERRVVQLRAVVGEAHSDLVWPQIWTVFPRLDPAAIDLTTLDAIPATLPGADGAPVAGLTLAPREHHMDLAELTGYRRHADTRAVAVFMAEVHSSRAQEVQVGAAADWWMAWYHDGKPVYDTMRDGNGAGTSILSHTFSLRLTPGRNLLAVRVLAGSHGWRLVVAGPHALAEARGVAPEHRLSLRLRAGDEQMVERTVPIRFRSPPAPWPEGGVAAVRAQAPDVILGARHVYNPWERVPGEHRWWSGDADLSGSLWLRRDAEHLHLVAAVYDEVHLPAPDGTTVTDHDALVLHADDGAGNAARWSVSGLGATPRSEGPGIRASVTRDAQAGVTVYHLAVARSALPGSAPRLNLRIHDRDADVPKQYLQWRRDLEEPRDVTRWYRCYLEQDGP